ncbi:hypothetical protein B0H14DRAFT_3760409 [Mycena olivaceomarginata]|nr:hypothetical protein B0H14DRAFT_3760409 [Mycena olivaceomarginata]
MPPMKFSAALFALAPLVAAVPAFIRDTTIASPKPEIQGNVFVCDAIDFAGNCATFHGASAQCVPFPSDFDNVISAFGPDSDQDCFIFVEDNCTGGTFGPIRNPGISDLRTIGFNDVISSFACFFG